jgi:predicted Zn-dependent protease
MYLKGKKALIVDDIAGMRSSMRTTLANLGIEDCDLASTAREAVDKMKGKFYDLVICDYYLGDATDGQQLLELVRRTKVISRKTLFIIVTAERTQDRVVAAADFMPDDYLVKPFTADVLGKRVMSLTEKKDYFHDTYTALDHDNLEEALERLEPLLQSKNKYWVDAMRLQGETLIRLGRYPEAEKVFDGIVALKPIPWAVMGKVKALKGQDKGEEAQYLLAELLKEHSEYLAGYDMLATLFSERGDSSVAQKLVEKALELAPVTHRQKRVGQLAFQNGDLDKAQQFLSEVVEKGKYSYFKEPEDYTLLSQVHIEKGDTEQARTVLDMVNQRFRESPEIQAQVQVYKAISWQKEGKPEQAKALLEPLLADPANVPDGVKLDLAKACFQLDDKEAGAKFARDVIQSNHDNPALKEQTVKMLESVGLGEQAREFVTKAVDEVTNLNNRGVALAREGKLEEASQLLLDAAVQLPHNVTILLNTAYVLMMFMEKSGVTAENLALVDDYVARAESLSPRHQGLLKVRELRRRLGE